MPGHILEGGPQGGEGGGGGGGGTPWGEGDGGGDTWGKVGVGLESIKKEVLFFKNYFDQII